MSGFKRFFVLACAACLFVCACLGLSACGEQVAATWSNGDIKEEAVTTAIENMRTNYGLTDDSTWQTFIENKSYDSDAASDDDSDDKKSKKNKDKEEETKGTVYDLRTYVINQMIRQDVIENEIKTQNVTVSDEEVDAYVEQQKAVVEAQYMEGIFESYLQKMGYTDLDEYKDEVRETLKESKLQEQATGSTSDDDAWDEYVDGLVEAANVVINDAPADLSYDIASDSSEESEASTDDSEASSDDASSTEDSASTASSEESDSTK